MTELLGYLQTGKLHWLTVPRYAIVALPLIVATGLAAAGAGWWVLPLWVVTALGLARLVWFKQLPHEKARLASAKAALAAAKPDLAISILQRPLSLGGAGYRLDRAALLAQAHTRQGNFIEAHRSLSAVDANHQLPDERLRLHRAWAGLLLEAGNAAVITVLNNHLHVARQLLEHRPTIDAHLATLSPLLLGPLNTWHSYRTDADKAEIELANQPQALQAAVARLFEHLREKAHWLTEQGTRRQAIEAWLVICDEYQAYRQQMPPATALHLLKGQHQHALQALDRASALLRQSKSTKQHIAHMIGLAYFHLQLRQDFTEAAHWQQQIDAHQPALDHFAGWLREHHAFVCAALRDVSPSAPAGHLHHAPQPPAARHAPFASPQGAPPCTG